MSCYPWLKTRGQVCLKTNVSVLNYYLVSFAKDILKAESVSTVVQHLMIPLKEELERLILLHNHSPPLIKSLNNCSTLTVRRPENNSFCFPTQLVSECETFRGYILSYFEKINSVSVAGFFHDLMSVVGCFTYSQFLSLPFMVHFVIFTS